MYHNHMMILWTRFKNGTYIQAKAKKRKVIMQIESQGQQIESEVVGVTKQITNKASAVSSLK